MQCEQSTVDSDGAAALGYKQTAVLTVTDIVIMFNYAYKCGEGG
jgi:hypothetical protein